MQKDVSLMLPHMQFPAKQIAVAAQAAQFPQTSILIAEDGELVAVTILPPPQGPGHDKAFDDYLKARAYARLVRLQFGWRIVDRCDNRTKLKALVHG